MLKISLIDPRTNRPFPHTTGPDRSFFAIEPGAEYIVRVDAGATRHDPREVVVAVDGRNVLDNTDASPRASGVVVVGTYDCKGFQTSSRLVRTFTAAAVGSGLTVAERNGSEDWIGLIWVAAYRRAHAAALHGVLRSMDLSPERGPSRGQFSLSAQGASIGTTAERGPSRGQFSLSAQGASIGTTAGREQVAPLGETEWERSGEPELVAVEYDTHDNFLRRGIVLPAVNRMWPMAGSVLRFSDPSKL